MSKKYFGTDGIRGKVNQEKINGAMFFKFGLAAGTYFLNPGLPRKRKVGMCYFPLQGVEKETCKREAWWRRGLPSR